MLPRLDIEAVDQPTVLYILYSTVSAQQTNLLPENASQNDTIFPKSRYGIRVSDHLAMLKFLWLRSHCTMYRYTVVEKYTSADIYVCK